MQNIRLALRSLGCITAFALLATTGSGPPRLLGMNPIGCKPSPEKVGTFSCAFTVRCSHGSTSHGSLGSLS
jgi:hypothetical protein